MLSELARRICFRERRSRFSVVVSVGAATEPEGIELSVTDTGPGIPPEVLPHVFDRFVKTPDSSGAGLGLAIAKSLVEAHGGEIAAESRPGSGTTMGFVVPVEPAKAG